ncbi:MAG: ABC transporter permease [Dehalococcoidia bacterium]|nr:ABC transporter permease [Dehalococcoidia bacterium]
MVSEDVGLYNPIVNDLIVGWRYAWSHFLSNWRFLAVVFAGVMSAAVLLALAPIYAASMTDLGLSYRLERDLATTREQVARVDTFLLQINDPVDLERRAAVDLVTQERVGWLGNDEQVIVTERSVRLFASFTDYPLLTDPFERSGNTGDDARYGERGADGIAVDENGIVNRLGPFTVTQRLDGEPVRQPWGAFVHTTSNLRQDTRLMEGAWPDPEKTENFEFVLPVGWSAHAAIGDSIRLDVDGILTDCPPVPLSEDAATARDEARCIPQTFGRSTLLATLVGFVEILNEESLRWELFQGVLEVPDTPLIPLPGDRDTQEPELDPRLGRAMTGQGQMPLLTTSEHFFGPFARAVPETRTVHRAGVVIDPDRINIEDVQPAINAMSAWTNDIDETLELVAVTHTRAALILKDFVNQQSFSAVPLLLILLQVVGIVIYYVAMTATNLLEKQSDEFGVFRSRGATTAQLVGFGLFEALLLAIPAAILAPWIAIGAVALLGLTPPFEPVTNGELLPVKLLKDGYLLGLVGAGIGLIGILIPTFIQARKGIVDVRRDDARPDRKSVIQRYYLDFLLLGFAAVLLWQVNQRGTLFDPDSVGGWSSDPVLLLTPFVLILAVAAMLLRFYPPVLKVLTAILLTTRSLATAIGLRRAGRAPAGYARLMLLILMSLSVGTFAASYGATVEKSLEERQRYLAAVDFRADLIELEILAERQNVKARLDTKEVTAAAFVMREQINTLSGIPIPILGIDPQFANNSIWVRDDFALDPFVDLIKRLSPPRDVKEGIELPIGSVGLQVGIFPRISEETVDGAQGAMRAINPIKRASFTAKFADANGRPFTSVLNINKDSRTWTLAGAEIPEKMVQPVSLLGFRAIDRVGQSLRNQGIILIDSISALDSDGQDTLIESFEETSDWLLYSAPGVEDRFSIIETAEALEGNRVAELLFPSAVSPSPRVIAPLKGSSLPLPVLMNPLAMSYFGVGNEGEIAFARLSDVVVPIVLVGIVDYFPSMDPAAGIIVTNPKYLYALSALFEVEDFRHPSELWVDFEDGISSSQTVELVENLTEFGAEIPVQNEVVLGDLLERTTEDPTLRVSGTGILTVAFVAVLTLTTLGFIVSLTLTTWQRTLEFAVLRALGTSRFTILRSLVLEWSAVLVLGVGLGLILGRVISQLMLSFLEVTEQGTPVLPPFRLITDWYAVGAAVAFLFVVVLVTLVTTWLVAMKRAGGKQLRITQ